MNIGNKIQELRKTNGITQEKLAAEMGVSIAAISKWENANSMPDILMLCSLAD
ncbi:helix-turn-helix transcriptional regulator [Gorillibacterium sp. CAU 1737]|uniref:helix-turn-helix domain-containing protein n=1 Tax=Gorillibacterium sp. CAU 1737 TaxID=3140362 RepID=UPI003260A113